MHRVSGTGARAIVLFLLFLQAASAWAIWRDVSVSGKATERGPVYYRALSADEGALRQALAAAPLEYTSSQGAEINLPMPDGSMQRFEVENSPIMAPELAARYPRIQTYRVKGIDDPNASGRLDMTPKGFHGMITSTSGTVFIDPDQTIGYRSYSKRAYAKAKKAVADDPTSALCLVEGEMELAARPSPDFAMRIEDQRRVYRLAVAATGEYTQFHGGTVFDALTEIIVAINRVNQIYGRDLAVQFVLVSNNDSVIYTDPASDPYDNPTDLFDVVNDNQEVLDSVIGSVNYDIGHVFGRSGGGLALVGGTCRPDVKAKGATGRQFPEGDPFYIDLVAHEMGHQMNATHSFNGTTDSCVEPNRFPESAVEPGSGSTIMAYAGICGAEDLQDFTDATFHAFSIQQIVDFITSGGGASCGALLTTGNTAPVVNAGIDYTIPAATPFALRGSATDADGDTLSYQWNEMDAGGDNYATDHLSFGTDLGGNPLFRSFLPKNTPLRIFPRLSSLLEGEFDKAEVLPTTQRTLNFRLTVRDGESGVAEDDVTLTVDTTQGPFEIVGGTLSAGGTFTGGTSETISWSVSNTDTACTQVDISLYSFSANGATYCDASDDSALNLGTYDNSIGSATITLPDKAISTGRVHIVCSDNIFFALSSADVEVISAAGVIADDCKGIDGAVVAHGTVFNDAGEGTTIIPPSDDGGGGGALLFLPLLLGLGAAGRAWDQARTRLGHA
jgi:hypothetical protein